MNYFVFVIGFTSENINSLYYFKYSKLLQLTNLRVCRATDNVNNHEYIGILPLYCVMLIIRYSFLNTTLAQDFSCCQTKATYFLRFQRMIQQIPAAGQCTAPFQTIKDTII
jgi:hypothetical protein